MGHEEVFAHVGRNVRIQGRNGRSVPILVTGTFGGSDFVSFSAFLVGRIALCFCMLMRVVGFTDPLVDGRSGRPFE